MDQSNTLSPFSATLYGELAQVHYHWHQLAKAREFFSHSVQWSTLGGFSDAEIYHCVFQSRLFQMEGNLQASVQEIEKALDLMQTAVPALVREEVISQQVSVFLAVDRLTESQAAIKPHGFAFEDEFTHPKLASEAYVTHPEGLLYNSALRTLLYRSRMLGEKQALQDGILLAEQVIRGSFRCRHLPIALQTLLLRAQLYVVGGNEKDGLADVSTALKLAEPEGFISLFVEEGIHVAHLLTNLLRRKLLGSVKKSYVESILAAFANTNASNAVINESVVGKSSIARVDDDLTPIAPLTAREREVLEHIAAGDSNQIIAGRLVITLSAVKKHTRNIYAKLNVNSRTQAVARARQLRLINSSE
jgi:LuxR family maltose regulon positive regulatory protein